MSDSNQLAVKLLNLAKAQFAGYKAIHLHHLNIVGPDFLQLHEYFGELYTMLWEDLDKVAERLRYLDYCIPASIFSGEEPKELYESDEMIRRCLNEFTSVDIQLNLVLEEATKLNSQATINMAAALQEKYDKEVWKLRSLLMKK
jgi:starvation-inducible DNA-binding protein